jgi:trans-aconitate 2-methyltransferase
MRKDTWDPAQYEKFLHQRSLPFFDLLALVRKRPGMRVADLGCGTGEWTARLHEELGARDTLGIDRSESMLAKSAPFVKAAGPGLRIEKGEVEAWRPDGPLDLVFSNAVLHFVPGQPELFARWRAALAPGGQFAIHIPANQDYPTHRVAVELATEAPYRDLLGGYVLPDNRLDEREYAHLLERLGFHEQIVRLQVYGHRLPNREEVVEWVRGSFLNEYKARLSEADFDRFFAEYRRRLMAVLPDERPFFFTFKRLLMWAALPETENA